MTQISSIKQFHDHIDNKLVAALIFNDDVNVVVDELKKSVQKELKDGLYGDEIQYAVDALLNEKFPYDYRNIIDDNFINNLKAAWRKE